MIRPLSACLAILAAAQGVFAQDAKDPPAMEISGFVFEREKDGLWLDAGDRPDPDDLASFLFLGPWITDCRVWPPHFENPDALGKVRVVRDRVEFESWLRDGAALKDVPRDWLRVLATQKDPEYEGASFHVDKVLAREELPEAWLIAWRDLDGANQDLARLLFSDPVEGRRAEIEAIATRHREACAAEKLARSKGELRDFEARIGRNWQRATAELLRRVGMGEGLPEFPTDGELADLFLKCAGKDELHALLLDRFGGDVMLEAMRLVHPVSREPGQPAEPDGDWIEMGTLFEMSEVDFMKLRDEARTITPAQRAAENSNVAGRLPVECERELKALGATVAQLSDEPCRRLLIPCGARIVSLVAGGPAESGGLKVGDILWTVGVDEPARSNLRNGTCPVRGPFYLDNILEGGPPTDESGWPFRFFRDGAILSAVVKK